MRNYWILLLRLVLLLLLSYRIMALFVQVINQFGSADGCRAMVSHLLETLSSLCLQLCQHGLSTLDPDTIQAFLRLLSTVL